ncbi:hypothetical protein TCAL_14688 [Tigriopus californicus]|uniref:Uncharacterized protein n=1 Tax=Tigriopus californicus TaxID=6832 RepID=A0A553NPV9_TIGCA|nr:hypothetical protein TCAL_14688 [Tigriopus californicus]
MEKDNFLNLVVKSIRISCGRGKSPKAITILRAKTTWKFPPTSNEISKTSPMKPLNSMNEEVVFDGIVRTPVTTKSGNVATRPNNTVCAGCGGNIDYYVTFSAKVNGSQHHLARDEAQAFWVVLV